MSGEPVGRSKAFSGVMPAAERVTELVDVFSVVFTFVSATVPCVTT